jgi:DNA-binding transcriptional LysR family regulator
MDRLHLISVFVAVVDAGSFTGAARKQGLSPPAVTRAINELERVLGVRLLTRTTRVVRVTEAGARYVEDCRRILAELADADESARGAHGEPRGHLTLTAPVLFGALYVTPVLTEYLRLHAGVTASALFLDRVVNLMEEGADVAVRIAELPDSSLQAVRVGQVRRVVCASPAYLAKHGIPRTPDDLKDHRLISAGGALPAGEWRLMRNGTASPIRVQPRLVTTTNDSALAAAVDGFGITRLLSYQVAEPLRAGRLVILLRENEPEPVPVHVVHREGRNASRKVRAFLDLAIERLRANPALQ